jgi:hypothetical protein
MVLRKNLNVEALGKVAECQVDGSALQLDAQGSFGGKAFQVIGRIQLRYGAGFWNEWFLLYSDGSNGWLGEALGQFFISSEVKDASEFPELRDLNLGAEVEFDGGDWIVLDRKTVQVHAFEGELPFVISSQAPFMTVDLRNTEGEGLTVDYSDATTSLFRGHWVPFSQLSLSGLRREADPSIAIPASETVAVKCSSCGAPHEISAPGRSQLLVCQYCDASLDATTPELQQLGQLMEKAGEIAKWAKVPLGTLAQLEDGQYKVIGLMISSTQVSGIRYAWRDYLLYNHLTGYRWLNENNGHYTLFEQLYRVPRSSETKRRGLKWYKRPVGLPPSRLITHNDEKFSHFSTSRVVVDKVVGEFYWRVQTGETSEAYDYVNPPEMISASVAGDDITWSLGRYLGPDELKKILPAVDIQDEPRGVAPAQPKPYLEARQLIRKPFWLGFAAAIVLIAGGFFLPDGSDVVTDQTALVTQVKGDGPGQSKPLSLTLDGEGTRGVAVQLKSPKKDGWVQGNATLRSMSSSFSESRGYVLADYKGKGVTEQTLVFDGVPAGEPLSLEFYGTTGPPTGIPPIVSSPGEAEALEFSLNYEVDVLPGNPNWAGLFYYWLLTLIPIWWLRSGRNRFEKKRWYESDYG